MPMPEIPSYIAGTPVSGVYSVVRRGKVTDIIVYPDDPTDERVWKFNLRTGRLFQVGSKSVDWRRV